MKLVRWALAIALLVCIAPLASPFIAAAISQAAGCTLNEGNRHPCFILGVDWGDTLYHWFVMGWVGLFMIPFTVLIVVAWVLIELVWLFLRRRANTG